MVIRVFISGISGLKEVKKRQQRVMMILESKHIPYETLDITESGRDADKEFMQQGVGPQPDGKFPFTPQIFNDDHYCGDYDQFDEYNEVDDLETFLGIEKMTPQQRLQNGLTNAQPEKIENGEIKEEEEPKPSEEETTAPEHPAESESEHPAATEPEHPTEEPATNDAPVEENSVEPPPPTEEREEAEGASGDAIDESRGEAEGSEEGAAQD